MNQRSVTDSDPTRERGRSRARVLELLRAADEPVSVAEIAAATGLHRNTARFHLDGLTDAGLACRRSEGGGRPGRPRTVYHAEPADERGEIRSWRLLAEMLTSVVTDAVESPAAAATEAGAAWGRSLVERPSPSERIDAADGLRRVHAVLTKAGFAPETDPDTADTAEPVLALRHCPFREVAEQHGDVVCSLHLGLMQGALAQTRAPLATGKLEPFVESSRCLARFVRTPA